ncbi:MAG: NAD(P)/FAD-dependent oxidoreductase [Patescibacteria group bacterium]|jgi:thioredoxin reductase (NADPH)
MDKLYDLIIVGGGAAGLTAGLFASRRGLSTLILSSDLGGQAGITPDIANYPGLPLTEGAKLMELFAAQAEKTGAKIVYETTASVHKANGLFFVATLTKKYQANSIILAFGKTPNDLEVPGETEFRDQIYHHIPKNHPKYSNVVVVGGGNSAVTFANAVAKNAEKVYLVCRTSELKSEAVLLKELSKRKNIEVIYDASVVAVEGSSNLNSVKILHQDVEKNIPASAVFVAVGYSNKTDWVKQLVAVDKLGQIIIQPDCSTSTEGVFAAGDVTTMPYKQVVISAGEGAKAAIAAHQYLSSKAGKAAPLIDWGKQKSVKRSKK